MNFEDLEKKVGFRFKNKDIIALAFIHRSYLNESPVKLQSNERLEFLGDSILSFLVSKYLYKTYAELPEGELTSLRSSIVKTKTLSEIAEKLDLGSLLKLSKGEDEGGGRSNTSILADTFEAFLGAVYLDQGLEHGEKVVSKFLLPKLAGIIEQKAYKDAKSSFQEIIQEKFRESPVYKVVSEIGPDHAKTFTVGVYVGAALKGVGKGKSKQDAEQKAAGAALAALSK